MSEVWLRRLGQHGPRLWAGGEMQHDEGRQVLQDGGGELLGPRCPGEGHGQGRGDSAGSLYSPRHVQLLGENLGLPRQCELR